MIAKLCTGMTGDTIYYKASGGSRHLVWGPQGAEGARIEAPKAPNGGGDGTGSGVWGGGALSQEFFFNLLF